MGRTVYNWENSIKILYIIIVIVVFTVIPVPIMRVPAPVVAPLEIHYVGLASKQ